MEFIMNKKVSTFLKCLVLPLAVGGLASLLTRDGMEVFATLNKPALSPPGWLFPVVWTILYLLMGAASYLVLTSGAPPQEIASALKWYLLQLAVNFFWPIFFFGFGWYLFSFLWLVVLWLLIVGTILAFRKVSVTASYLLLPYLLWVTFAGYLNLFIYFRN